MFASGNALPTLISAVSGPDTKICPTLSSLGAMMYLFLHLRSVIERCSLNGLDRTRL